MEKSCNDAIFGVMQYKHRWVKKQTISAFGKEWEMTIAAKAYSGKPITKEQQDSYVAFVENDKTVIDSIEKTIISYVNENLKELAAEWIGARKINSIADLADIVVPKTILFKQDGTAIMLLNCVWDVENGLAVKFFPDIKIGSQDLFL